MRNFNRACRGIRRFNGRTEPRVGPNLYVDPTVFDGLGDATFDAAVVNPLDLDAHMHPFYGQGWTARNRSSQLMPRRAGRENSFRRSPDEAPKKFSLSSSRAKVLPM